ncbi:DNA polymerase III, subunits gamma and tau [Shewanella halifaxensis HAW-EB4]|uniref:DNA-directed DNA polymerase n=1 Tax=Shewanella halifaxensis (strain HAW-EB4) TaxID=458817 RepID=B0TNZ9_SHEHH|nr:DNA polymerase III subunit gamma/tau [Shewanella halifaxensis]ABZ76156.1 DNA polymerase III, subunits gamma and tau [Shewanella halifaxensis HAW-EB4]
MSYQVLARKWRPATFEQMVGQSHVLHALTNALTQQRLHHAYLFSGTRGVGKTSLARLFAKGLNCEQGVTATPCGKCSACVEIAEGRFVDLIEVDAASRTKVDDTRELLDNVQYRPSRGRYKVYLIDEVHMLSRSSFNALLKTLEEPPEHVKFLLATTDPQRLPVTVLSRCLQFNLKSLTQDEIATQISHILSQEQLSFEDAALTLLAKAANGSMRDALSLTDQAIAFGAGQVKLEQVQTMLGSIDEKHVLALLEALAKADIMDLMQVTAKVLSFGADPEEVLRSLLELLHQITLTQFAPAAAQMSLYSEQISAFAQQLSAEQVQLYYQLLLTGRKDLPHAPDPKSGLEMALLRAVTFVPEKPVTRWAVETKSDIALPDISTSSQQVINQAESAATTKQDATQHAQEPVNSAAGSEAAPTKLADTPEADAAAVQVNNEQQVSADESTQAPTATDVEPEVLSEQLDSLNSEMAVIMSQAQGQGFKDGTEQAQPSAQENVSHTDYHQGQVAQTVTVDDTIQDGSVQNHSVQGYADAGQGDDDLASYADYAGAYGSNEDSENTDYGFGHASSSYQPERTSQNVHQSENNTSETQQASQTPQPAESSTGTADRAASDDILDAVLAARATLLEGLGEDDPKEESSKKSLEGRKPFTPPARKEPVAQSNSPTVSDTNSSKETPINENTAPKLGPAADLIDRPPWEEPHEQDPCARFDDASTPVKADEGDAKVTSAQAMSPQVDNHASDDAQGTADSNQGQVTADSSPVQDAELNLPLLPSGELTGNDVDLKWYRFMSELEVGGRVRQLAVNSVCHQFEQPLSLLLKPDQKHLAADIAIKQLEEAMTNALGEPCSVSVAVGVDNDRETPLEVRRRFHKEILVQAHHDLMTDDNIRWLTQNMGAQMTADSLTYAPELLVQKGNQIELIDIANFKRLTES